MNITSPDLTQFNYTAIIDLTTGTVAAPTPTIKFTDTSIWTAPDPIQMIFNLYSPSNVLLHEGDFATPDIIAEGGNVSFNLITFQNMVQWGVYKMEAWVKDSNGTIFKWTDSVSGHDYKTINVCRINNCGEGTPKSQFPCANLLIQTDCENKKICISDQTPTVYQGVTGNPPDNVTGFLVYPADESGVTTNQPIEFLPSCFVIALNGRYQIVFSETVQYDLPLDTGIIFKYSYNNDNYIVQCNLDLCAIECDYVKLIAETKDASEGDPEKFYALNQKLGLITAKIIQFNLGKTCGVDVSGILAEIAEIGGFDCNCNCAPTAIAQVPISSCPITMSIVNQCGDIIGSVLQSGINFQITLADKTYEFTTAEDTEDYATITKSTVGCVSTVTLQFTELMLDIIANRCKVKVSVDDECCDYLGNKLTAIDGTIIITPSTDEGGCETLDFKINPDLVTIPDWVNLVLDNGWSNQGGAFQTAQIRKWTTGQEAGKVEMRGTIKHAAWDGINLSVFTTIAAGYRPTLNQMRSTVAAGNFYATMLVVEAATGDCSLNATLTDPDNVYVPIDCYWYTT